MAQLRNSVSPRIGPSPLGLTMRVLGEGSHTSPPLFVSSRLVNVSQDVPASGRLLVSVSSCASPRFTPAQLTSLFLVSLLIRFVTKSVSWVSQKMAEQITGRRARRGSVPKETQDVLEQHYQTNPYPNRFEYIIVSRNANIDMQRLKNWFNNRRRNDSKLGILCRRCRCFKAPTNEHHVDESGHFRPCHEVWNLLFQAKEANDNQMNSASPPVNGNYAHQFVPPQGANPLSTFVDTATLIRFMNAWHQSRNESLPFYPNQQFVMQQHQNTAPMWMNQQQIGPFQAAPAFLPNAWINQQPTDLAQVNRNYQQEFQFNAHQMAFNQNMQNNGNNVFSSNGSISFKLDE